MKKILMVASLFLSLALASACKPQDTQAIFEDLLAADYEVYYIFYSLGLPVDGRSQATVEYQSGLYQPCTSPKYKQLGHLRQLVESVYSQEETIQKFLERRDSDGNPLFVEIDNQLYQSVHGTLQMPRFEATTPTLLEDSGNRMVFSVQEESLDGSLYQCTMSMVKTSRGWRLELPRQESEHTLVQEGSSQEYSPFAETPQQVAEDFLSALAWGDTKAIEDLTGALRGTYRQWKNLDIDNAQMDTLEEGDGYGTYRVTLQIQNDDGPLPQGTSTYILSIQPNQEGQELMVQSFWREPLPYSWLPVPQQQDLACNLVLDFVELFGQRPFAEVDSLSQEAIAEYCLTQLTQDRPFDELMKGVSPLALAKAAQQYFGIQNFSALDTSFYNAQLQVYYAQSQPETTTHVIVVGSQPTDGGVVVETHSYTDPLSTQNRKILRYTLAHSANGTYRFVKGEAA